MSNLTLWGANEVSRILFGQRSIPGDYYLALAVSGNPNSYMSANEVAEPPAGSGYARLYLPNNAATFDTDGYQTAYNRDRLTFTEATADWGDVRYWALCNAPSEGEVYCYGQFTSQVTVTTGDIVVIQPAALKITVAISSTSEDPF